MCLSDEKFTKEENFKETSIEEEISHLGLNEDEIKDVHEMASFKISAVLTTIFCIEYFFLNNFKKIYFLLEREIEKNLYADKPDPIHLLHSNISSVSAAVNKIFKIFSIQIGFIFEAIYSLIFILKRREKFKELIDDIKKDTEYIQEIPKWQLDFQRRLDELIKMRKVWTLNKSLPTL